LSKMEPRMAASRGGNIKKKKALADLRKRKSAEGNEEMKKTYVGMVGKKKTRTCERFERIGGRSLYVHLEGKKKLGKKGVKYDRPPVEKEKKITFFKEEREADQRKRKILTNTTKKKRRAWGKKSGENSRGKG